MPLHLHLIFPASQKILLFTFIKILVISPSAFLSIHVNKFFASTGTVLDRQR